MRRIMPLAHSMVGLPRRGVAAVLLAAWLLAAWLLAAGLLGTDPPAAAQSVTTFLSNTGQNGGISFLVRATAFETGSSTYTLSSVGVYTLVPTGSTTPAVAIYGDNGGKPGTLLATMTMRASTIIRTGVSTFTAPAGTTLSASTTYWVVTSNSAATDGQGFRVGVINNATPDSGAAAGWSIGSARSKSDITDTSWVGDSFRILFQIRGTTGSTGNAPTVANTIPDQAATVATPFSYVFPTNTFSDTDGDTLAYTATRADGAVLPTWLTFTDATRAFSGTPQAGDVGTVSVKVTASDGKGGSVSDTFDIMVNAAADTTPPTLSSSVIDSAGLTLHLFFSENLQQSNPPRSSAFTVTANDSAVMVSIDALDPSFPKRISVSVSPTILQGQTVVVTYTDPNAGDDANAIQDVAGNEAATFTTGSGGVTAVTNSSTVVAATAPGAPGAPTGLSATASGTTINLSWTAPGNNGGSAITGYKIEVSSDGGVTWTDLVANTSSPDTTYPHTGLAAGATRHYRVSAINTAGTGTSSRIDSATTGTTGNGGGGGGGGGGFAGGGGGGGGRGPSPSDVDFEWNVKRDIEELAAGNTRATGIWSDGETLWVADNADGAGDAVYAYDLATGERLEEREFELADANRAPRGIWSDRVTVWVSDSGQERLYAYDLASDERVEEHEIVLDEDNADARGIWSDDETMWVLDGGKDGLFAYDLATGELLAEYGLDPANDDPRGLWSDRTTVWVSDHRLKRLFAYRLPARPEAPAGEDAEPRVLERVSDEEFPSTVLSRASNNSPRGLWSDGDVMYVADESDDRVYTYNMPDAIDARLASLSLSGVDIGDFDPGRVEYEGTVAEGVTQATVEAGAAQRRARVAVDPPDADPETAGHQVSVEGGPEITVTVTSGDGTRTTVYLVRVGETDEGWAHCLSGAVAAGFSLVFFEGGSLEELEECAQSRHVGRLYALEDGAWVPDIIGAPAFVNRAFGELFADGVPSVTALIAGSSGPSSGDPAPEGPLAQGSTDCLRGEVASGFSIVVYSGGSVEELDDCARSLGVATLYALEDGAWVPYIIGAPEFVNRSFVALYADGLSPMTPLVARSDGPPTAGPGRDDAAGG